MMQAATKTARSWLAADPLRSEGLFYMATGIWPIVHLRSFMAVTGPKRDTWLVRTFGALTASIGAAMLPTSGADRATQSQLAVGTAVTLAACEVVFVVRGRISPIYLADAAVELALAAAVARATPTRRPGSR
jgi:hypothetical protein